jgi:hypothetical protein
MAEIFFSATYVHHPTTVPAFIKYVHGQWIDIGYGDMPYGAVIVGRVTRYPSLDRRTPCIGDHVCE